MRRDRTLFLFPILAAGALAWACASARADIVKLKNGNTMDGKILDENEETVVLKTASGGTMTLKKADVASVERREEPEPEPEEVVKPDPKKKPRPGVSPGKKPVKKPPPKKAATCPK